MAGGEEEDKAAARYGDGEAMGRWETRKEGRGRDVMCTRKARGLTGD